MPDRDESVSRAPVLFEVGGKVVTASDVVVAAHVRGALEPAWRDFLAGLAAEREAARLGMEADAATVEENSDELRYARNLLTAEGTDAWLGDWGLTFDDLDAFCRREHWRVRCPAVAPETGARWHESPADRRELFQKHLTLSGTLSRWSEELARRMAVLEELPPSARPPIAAVEAERSAFLERTGVTDATALVQAARCPREELDRLLAMETAFRAHHASFPTPKARERVVESMRLPLTRVEMELLTFATADAAREAAMCIREDGLEPAALAREYGCAYTRERRFLQDLPEELRDALVSAAPGDVLAPMPGDDGEFRLRRLLAKRDPDASDPEVLERVDEEILDAHYRELTARRVRRILLDEGAA